MSNTPKPHSEPRELNPHAAILLSFVNETDESKIPSYDQVEAAVHGLVEQVEALRVDRDMWQETAVERQKLVRTVEVYAKGLQEQLETCERALAKRTTELHRALQGSSPAKRPESA